MKELKRVLALVLIIGMSLISFPLQDVIAVEAQNEKEEITVTNLTC